MPPATVDDLRRARRVLLHGVTGSGKSTAAVALGRVLDLPVHLVDDEFGWLPNWVQRPVGDMRALVAEVMTQPGWVFDSTYSSFRDLVEPHVEVVVALDYPRWLSLARLCRRTISRVITKDLVCNGNTENWRAIFSRESIILWHFRSFARKRRTLRAWEHSADGPPVLRLEHPRDLRRVLAQLAQPAAQASNSSERRRSHSEPSTQPEA